MAAAARLDCPAMATVEVQGVDGMQSLLGQEIGPSEWRTAFSGRRIDELHPRRLEAVAIAQPAWATSAAGGYLP